MVVNSRDSYGMPTSITIGYLSEEFGQAETSSSNEKAFITWNMTGGNEFYTGSPPGTLSVDSTSQFTIDLDRSNLLPEVADYTIELTAVLSYTNNRGSEFMMDMVVYKFDVNVAGLASSATVSTTSGSVILEPTDSSVSYGEDIVLVAIIDDNALNVRRSLRGLNTNGGEAEETLQEFGIIWVDDMEPVIASSTDTRIIGFDYVWPNNDAVVLLPPLLLLRLAPPQPLSRLF
jgi:hypothetical protein